MKNAAFLLMIFLGLSANCQQQLPLSVLLTDEIKNADRFVGTDPYGYAYVIANNALIKTKNIRDASFQEPSLGRISRVDLTNPLQIVVFYENFNTIILLDSQLNKIQRIDFNKLQNLEEPVSVTAAGLASQNRIWLYDALSRKVALFDLTKKTINSVSVSLPYSPLQYQTSYNNFIWLDQSGTAFSIDIFGKVSSLGKIPESSQFQYLQNGKIMLLEKGRITVFDPLSNSSNALDIGEKTFTGFYYSDQILSIFTKHGITNYKITIP